jgi:hypothetical protein
MNAFAELGDTSQLRDGSMAATGGRSSSMRSSERFSSNAAMTSPRCSDHQAQNWAIAGRGSSGTLVLRRKIAILARLYGGG